MDLPKIAPSGTPLVGDYEAEDYGSAIFASPRRDLHRPPPIDLDDAPVTRPFLPPLEEFQPYLERIWANRWLTNSGPFHQQLEEELADYLSVDHVALTANGTSALQLALQALDIRGEVITTPFTFVATAHALTSRNLRPTFVDIDPKTGNLDPEMIERAITSETRAIMPVHCFGHPCQTDRIAEIAENYGLKVIYDGAHAFNVRCDGESILRSGDASCLSFHATKVFNTFEGGAVVCADAEMKARVTKLRNFGFSDANSIDEVGTNAKMSEFQAAFGLLQLKYVDEAIARRGVISARYSAGLRKVPGIRLFETQAGWQLNHSYYPMLLEGGLAHRRGELCAMLLTAGVHARPYFWPLVSDYSTYRDLPSAKTDMPVARSFADRILCLPLYPDLAARHVETAVAIIGDFIARLLF